MQDEREPEGQHDPSQAPPGASPEGGQGLIRGLGLKESTAANVVEMVGIGPFITIPILLGFMGGPQALLGWLVGAILAVSDGLVWAELGAATLRREPRTRPRPAAGRESKSPPRGKSWTRGKSVPRVPKSVPGV